MALDPDEMKAYVNRPWGELRRLKEKHWLSQTPEARLDVAFALYVQAKLNNPDWPTQEERDSDLETHIRVSRLFRMADEQR